MMSKTMEATIAGIRVESVNVGRIAPIGTASGRSAIAKRPVLGPAFVSRDGIIGDECADRSAHGGLEQAIYCYCQADYDHFVGVLQRDLPPGIFGENLTLSGIETADVGIGDRFRAGALVFEVSAPRTPCATFAAHMNNPKIVKLFAQSLRSGFYARIITEGTIEAGAGLEHRAYAGDKVPVTAMMQAYLTSSLEPDMRRRMLAAPINAAWRSFIAAETAS
jgi:MOSC domain-containing protein YiiM